MPSISPMPIAWRQLHAVAAEEIVLADVDDNGKADAVVDFGAGHGVWTLADSGGWVQVRTLSPELMVVR